MKKASKVALIAKPLAIAAVLTCACASAQAQSNVTIYGRVTAGVTYQTNQAITDATGNQLRDQNGNVRTGSKSSLGGNDWGTSMFGFKGTEDLGGGTKALFLMESGFSSNNGSAGGGLWTRRSYVGLSGSFGTIKMGKDLAIQSDNVWAIDPTGQQAVSTATLVKERNWPQTNNMISYETPNYGGFSGTYMHGFGNAAGTFTGGPGAAGTDGSRDGIALVYVQPTYEVRAIYNVQRDNKGEFSSLYKYSKDFTLGGTYTIDKLKLFAGYENLSANSVAATDPDGANHYWLGANYQITPALTLIGAAYHVNVNKGVGSANLFMLGGNYSLSKRTLLYATIGTVRNGANTDFAVQYGPNGVKGQNQNTFYTGIAHSF